MLGVSLDLGRMPHMALNQDGISNSRKRNRAGEKERAAGDKILRLPDIGIDLLGWLFGARADAGQSQRRAHQLQELTAPLRVVPFGRLLGKFPMKILAELRGVRELPKAAPVHASVGAGKSGFNRRIHALSLQFPVTSFRLSSLRSHRCSVQFHWKLEAGNWQLSMTRRTAGEL